jgi:DNA invertase Pin-like site-specific DNA recombinase
MAEIGYIRVSSTDQNTSRQLEGVQVESVFEDKCSGADTKRPGLKGCLAYIRSGDTLHVHSIDRLARNLADLLRLVTELTGRGICLRFHKENLAFGCGESDAMSELMLSMLGAVAQFERSLIKERQREGIAKAKEEGRQMGRARKLTAEQEAEIRIRAASKDTDKKALAAEFGISRQCLYAILGRG